MSDHAKRHLVETFAGSHRLYREGDRYIIADYSGPDPETTDDGILYVDTSRPVTMGRENGDDFVLIPLTSPKPHHRNMCCSETLAGAFDLAHRLGMKILVKSQDPSRTRLYATTHFEPFLDTREEERQYADDLSCGV